MVIQRALAFLSALRPIAPWHWQAVARSLAAGEGWMPPMMVVAAIGSAWSLHGLWEMILGRQAALPLQGLTWLTWCLVGLAATLLAARRGAANLLRYGAWGPVRPRWWFEVGRLAWILTLLDALVLGTSIIAMDQIRGGAPQTVAPWALSALGPLLAAFLITGTMGYLLSWVRGRPMRGKAYECVDYFYLILVGIFASAAGVWLWQANAALGQLLAAALLCAAGLAIMLRFFVATIRRYERNEARRGR